MIYEYRINSRDWTESFDTIKDLIEGLKYYGLPLSLAEFKSFDSYGMSTNNYREYSVIAYK